MKLFRLRFIILGLLLCVFHVWCRTCGTTFTSHVDSAYLSQVVVEGQVYRVWDPLPSGRYNVTIRIRRVRKGDHLLINGKKTKLLTVGEFGDEDKQLCVTQIRKNKEKRIFFLKSATLSQLPSDYLTLSAFPVKVSKKSIRDIRKITCRRCAKKPILKKIRSKDIREGRRIRLGCRVKTARPPPTFRWEKDGEEIKSSKRIKIKSNKRGSRLTIRRALKTDGGEYRCIATNVVGTTESVASFKVKPKLNRNTKKTQRPKPTTTPTVPLRYKPCLPKDKDYCLNGGQCRIIVEIKPNVKSCVCLESYIGKRCQYFRGPIQKKILPADTQKLERDRTLAIIGIVIGILIFVCICIASYFLAKRRRERFLKRQEKRKYDKSVALGNSTNSYSYLKFPQNLEFSSNYPEFAKMKLTRQNTTTTDTQTDDIGLYQPNSNPKVNLYLNPIENVAKRNSVNGTPNSRSRLSGVSLGDKPSTPPNSPDSVSNTFQKMPEYTQEKPRLSINENSEKRSKRHSHGNGDRDYRRKGEVPRIKISDSGSDTSGSYGSLRISEDSPQTNSMKKTQQKAFLENNPSQHISNKTNRNNVFNNKTAKRDGLLSRTSASESPSTSTEEIHAHFSKCGRHKARKYSDTLSWNERGSPEHQTLDTDNTIEDPRYKNFTHGRYANGYDCNDAPTVQHAVYEDEPSIPI